MYSKSSLFSKAFKYCELNFDKILILSAKYGVLEPSQVIEPYDETINKFSKKQREMWFEKCKNQIAHLVKDENSFFFFSGKNYEMPLPNSFYPMRGMGIGKRLKFLSK